MRHAACRYRSHPRRNVRESAQVAKQSARI